MPISPVSRRLITYSTSAVYIDLIGGLIGANMSEPHIDMKCVRHVWICYSTVIPKSRKPAFYLGPITAKCFAGPVQNQAIPKINKDLNWKVQLLKLALTPYQAGVFPNTCGFCGWT